MSSTLSKQTDMLERARALEPRLIEFRRQIHSHPELSFNERETCRMVAGLLSELGYCVRPGIGGTGVMAEIGQGRTVIIRADMDALPIVEDSDKPYISTNSGVMHACGHDVHTACGLGAAILLAETPPPQGRIRFLFQPAEETVNEEGKSGATLMIEQGGTEDAEGIFALHVDPRLPAGQIGLRQGVLLAACDSFQIVIKGLATHGAYPEHGIDAIVLASQVVQSMQTIISRKKSALAPAVLTIGGIRSLTYRPNIVAEEVEIIGTVRYFEPAIHDLMETEINNSCKIAEVMGGSYQLRYSHDTPSLVNDAQLTQLVRYVGKHLLGSEAVTEMTQEMGGDDFSFLSNHMPGCYFALGAKIEGSPRMLHTPTFDIDESALPIGAAMLAESALRFLT